MPNAVWHSALTFVIWHSSFQVGALSPRAHVDARRAAVPIDAARLGRELVRPFTHAAVPPRAVAFGYRGRGLGSLEILHVRIRPAEPENIPCHVVASCESRQQSSRPTDLSRSGTATRARCLSWQEVTMARDGLRGHLSGSLPISVAVHLVVLLTLFAVPLIGNIIVPTVMATAPGYMLAAPAPPPPELVVRSVPQPPQNTATDTPAPIPTTAPTAILPERDARSFNPEVAPPDSTAIGNAVGVPLGLGAYAPPPRPPNPPKPSGPVRVADLPVAPRKTEDMRPIYPDIARQARIEGTVVMEAVLDPSGRVTQLHVIKSVPMLDQAALDAVRQWRYTPSVYGGRPVSVLMTITVRFTLQ